MTKGATVNELAGTVDPNSRLFNRAVRLPGWSHLFANLCKFVVRQVGEWPTIIKYLRALCRFFRYEPWRTFAPDTPGLTSY